MSEFFEFIKTHFKGEKFETAEEYEAVIKMEKAERKFILASSVIGAILGTVGGIIFGISEGDFGFIIVGMGVGVAFLGCFNILRNIPRYFKVMSESNGFFYAIKWGFIGRIVFYMLACFGVVVYQLIALLAISSRIDKLEKAKAKLFG